MPRLSPQDPLFLAVIFHELRYLASTTPKHHAVAFSFRFSSRVPLIHLCDTSTLILDRSFISSSLPRTLTMSPPSLQTPLSKLLGIQYPIILAGMASLSCTNCM
jgi:hypothetical protein